LRVQAHLHQPAQVGAVPGEQFLDSLAVAGTRVAKQATGFRGVWHVRVHHDFI
jgi:hypothetical protein